MKIRASLCVVACILCAILIGCEVQSDNLLQKYNQLCREEYSVESYNTAFRAVTTNKNTGKTATYTREVDKKGNIHLTVSNNNYKGEVYYKVNDLTCYLKQNDDEAFMMIKDFDPSLVYTIPMIGNFTLGNLGFKLSDTVDMKVEGIDYKFYITSDELNEAYIIVDGQLDGVKKLHIDNDDEVLDITFYEPTEIHLTPSDDVNAKPVDADLFTASLMHLKLNGYIADGVHTMDNTKVFSIDATVVNPEDTENENKAK